MTLSTCLGSPEAIFKAFLFPCGSSDLDCFGECHFSAGKVECISTKRVIWNIRFAVVDRLKGCTGFRAQETDETTSPVHPSCR